MRWTARDKRAVALGASVVALIALYVAVVEPVAEWSQSVGMRLEAKEAGLRTIQLKAARRQGLEERVRALRLELGLGADARSRVGPGPSGREGSAQGRTDRRGGFIGALEREARQCGIEIKGLGTSRARETAGAAPGSWQGLTIRAECDAAALAQLLFWLERGAGTVVVDKIVIDSKEKPAGAVAVELEVRIHEPRDQAPARPQPRRREEV